MRLLRLARHLSPWHRGAPIASRPSAVGAGHVRRELERMARSRHRILVGPWLSELGFEILYWIPFLNWAIGAYGLARERLIVVSRGGAGALYSHLAAQYVDLLTLWTVEEYRRKNEARWREDGNQPQYVSGALDDEALALVRRSYPGEEFEVLHPAVMHQLFRPYWYEKGPFSLLRKHTRYRRSAHPAGPLPGLPTEYVAVRFYVRPSFPDTPANRLFVTSLIARLSQRVPVVLLNTGMTFDDHPDLPVAPAARIHRIDHLVSAANNIDVQFRVVRHARALVGTYGGVTHLAPLCGVPSVGFYSDDIKLLPAHLDASVRLGRTLNAPLLIVPVDQSPMLGLIAAAMGGTAEWSRG